MKMKKILIATTMVFLSKAAFAGGIPVIDASAIAKHIEQIAQMKEQIENQVKQIVELKNQVQAMTGSRQMGEFLKDQLGMEIPDEWKDIYNATDKLADGKLKEKLGNFDPKAGEKGLIVMLEHTEKTFEDIRKRVERIDELTKKIDQTQDIKASQDLNARIQTEQLALNNQQVKLDQMQRMYELEKELQAEKAKKEEICASEEFRRKHLGSTKPNPYYECN